MNATQTLTWKRALRFAYSGAFGNVKTEGALENLQATPKRRVSKSKAAARAAKKK